MIDHTKIHGVTEEEFNANCEQALAAYDRDHPDEALTYGPNKKMKSGERGPMDAMRTLFNQLTFRFEDCSLEAQSKEPAPRSFWSATVRFLFVHRSFVCLLSSREEKIQGDQCSSTRNHQIGKLPVRVPF